MKRLSFLILLFCVPFASAVGFANLPGQREFLFTPGGHVEVPVFVTNAAQIRATLSSPDSGDPSTLGTPQDDNILEYVRLEDPAPDGGPRQVRVIFDFPEQMAPGTYFVYVHSSEIVGHAGSAVSAVASAQLGLTVRVLSPEKVIEITGFDVPPVAEGLQANATVRFISRTSQDIGQVRALFTIPGGEVQASAGPVPLASAEPGALTGVLPTELLPGGEYDVHATVTYDGQELSAGPALLKIGTLHVDVPEYTRNLTHNATNKFQFNVTNQWNQELRDVYAIVRAGGQEKRTASLNVPPFGKQTYEVYFDREPVFPVGHLPVNITVAFQDYNPATRQYATKQESFLLMPHVDHLPEEQGLSAQMLLMYSLAGLILLLLVIVLLLLRRRKQPELPQV